MLCDANFINRCIQNEWKNRIREWIQIIIMHKLIITIIEVFIPRSDDRFSPFFECMHVAVAAASRNKIHIPISRHASRFRFHSTIQWENRYRNDSYVLWHVESCREHNEKKIFKLHEIIIINISALLPINMVWYLYVRAYEHAYMHLSCDP